MQRPHLTRSATGVRRWRAGETTLRSCCCQRHAAQEATRQRLGTPPNEQGHPVRPAAATGRGACTIGGGRWDNAWSHRQPGCIGRCRSRSHQPKPAGRIPQRRRTRCAAHSSLTTPVRHPAITSAGETTAVVSPGSASLPLAASLAWLVGVVLFGPDWVPRALG